MTLRPDDRSRPNRASWTAFGRGYGWFDHVMRAQERYQDSKGDFYAAGITYFTIFAFFPLLMVGFAIGGFVLARQPDLLARSRSASSRRCPATSVSNSST